MLMLAMGLLSVGVILIALGQMLRRFTPRVCPVCRRPQIDNELCADCHAELIHGQDRRRR